MSKHQRPFSPSLLVGRCESAVAMAMLRWPVISFMAFALGSRLPAIRTALAVSARDPLPFSKIVRCGIPSGIGLHAATMHSVSGATRIVALGDASNPADATVGQPFSWSFRTTGEKPKSYSLDGLPPGIEGSPVVTSGVSAISGIPSRAGDYGVTIVGWEERDQRGRRTPAYRLRIRVAPGGEPPAIEAPPRGGTFLEGGEAVLAVSVSGADVAYQWFREGRAISGATGPELRLPGLRPQDAGRYRVEATNGAGPVAGAEALVEVLPRGSYAAWRHGRAGGGDLADPSADSDGDGLNNFGEYALGGDPARPDTRGRHPRLSTEVRKGRRFLVAEWSRSADAAEAVFTVEASPDGRGVAWAPVDVKTPGVTLTGRAGFVRLRVPFDEARGRLFRLRAVRPEGG